MNTAELDFLAGEMFRTFSRFEYALKAVGFRSENRDVKADWAAFASTIPNALRDSQDQVVRDAVDFILTHPPKKQAVKRGLLVWKDSAPSTGVHSDKVLIYVRRVRNNLFHGGKFNGHWFEPERSRDLLRCSLIILRACIEASRDVKAAYEG